MILHYSKCFLTMRLLNIHCHIHGLRKHIDLHPLKGKVKVSEASTWFYPLQTSKGITV